MPLWRVFAVKVTKNFKSDLEERQALLPSSRYISHAPRINDFNKWPFIACAWIKSDRRNTYAVLLVRRYNASLYRVVRYTVVKSGMLTVSSKPAVARHAALQLTVMQLNPCLDNIQAPRLLLPRSIVLSKGKSVATIPCSSSWYDVWQLVLQKTTMLAGGSPYCRGALTIVSFGLVTLCK